MLSEVTPPGEASSNHTCTGVWCTQNIFKKHFLGLSDNVTYFVEHLNPTSASKYRYRVIFRPTTVVPDVEIDLGQ
jgi:hypothetical protein